MMKKRFTQRVLLAVICVLALVFPSVAGLVTCQQEETLRKLWDTKYIDNSKNLPVSKRAAAKRKYRVVTPTITSTLVSAETVIGVTIWRLRHAKSADAGERLIVHEGSGSAEWIPERASSDTKFAEGDRIRLSFEAARAGYLYVIDRE